SIALITDPRRDPISIQETLVLDVDPENPAILEEITPCTKAFAASFGYVIPTNADFKQADRSIPQGLEVTGVLLVIVMSPHLVRACTVHDHLKRRTIGYSF